MIRFSIDHPVATWMIFTALIICGVYALPRLDIEAMPEVELPSLSIETAWNGASPGAVLRSITIPIEEAARKCHGVDEIQTRSSPGRSQVSVSFRRDTNMEFARLELSEQLGAVRRALPGSAGQPAILPYVPEEFRTEEYFTVSLISPLSASELREEAEAWLIPRLLAIPGVADAELQGGARPLVKVLLNLEAMERYGLTADVVFNRLSGLDAIIPAGVVRRAGMEFTVSVQDSVSLDALRETVLASVGGQSLTLAHVAEVREDFEDPSYFVRINGENVIQANISKRSGENAVAVSRRLRSTLPEIEATLPFPVTFEIDEDQGKELENKLLELVYRSLIILMLLFVLLAVALRQVRLTAIVVSSILLAIVICLSMFYFFDISVNFITISGLTVCFGMLLDNSILVLDAIHRRLTGRESVDSRLALISGTHEVAFPILATTLTTIVAFLSFIFLSGRLSLHYVPLAVSVGIAMLASIFVAFSWMPVALKGPAAKGNWGRPGAAAEGGAVGRRRIGRWVAAGVFVLMGVTGALVATKGTRLVTDYWEWAAGIAGLLVAVALFAGNVERITAVNLRFWWIPVLVMGGLFFGSAWVFKNEIHQGGFWRQGSEEELRVYIERPIGTDVLLSTETMKFFEAELLPVPEGVHMRSVSWENRAFLRVRFEPELLRSHYPELFRSRLIILAEELGGMFIWIAGFGDPYLKGGTGGGMSNSLIKIAGYNSKTLDEITEGVMARLERQRRVRNVRLTSGDRFERAGADETVILIDRDQLAAHHISVGQVVGHLRRLLGIENPWHMIVEGEDRRLQLSFADSQNIQYDQVANQTIVSPSGEEVHLRRLIRLETRPVFGSINREDQRYSAQINWEYIGTDRMRQAFIGDILAGIQLPYGYTAEDVSGERVTEEEEEEMKLMLWLTVLFIFMCLSGLFESLFLPLLVLLAVPMGLTGVVGLFWATDSAFDSSAKIGLVLLFGIVVNNAILLINRFRLQVRELVAARNYPESLVSGGKHLGGLGLWRLRKDERKELLREAICKGTRIQLRSILLTSGTTIAGLIPLLVRIADTTEGKDIWENLALSSIGGLASSTVLILTGLPALYWVATRLGWTLAAARSRLRRSAVSSDPEVSRVG